MNGRKLIIQNWMEIAVFVVCLAGRDGREKGSKGRWLTEILKLISELFLDF
jgi:hypothetical protein